MLGTGEQNAIRKAIHLNGATMVQRAEYGRYQVPSATEAGVIYVITGTAIDGSDHRCSCPAGEHGKPCWHSASVRLRRVQEEAKRQYRQLLAGAVTGAKASQGAAPTAAPAPVSLLVAMPVLQAA